jgi:hypothetical protein
MTYEAWMLCFAASYTSCSSPQPFAGPGGTYMVQTVPNVDITAPDGVTKYTSLDELCASMPTALLTWIVVTVDGTRAYVQNVEIPGWRRIFAL